MADNHAGGTLLHIQAQVAELILDQVIVPMIVAGHIDLDRAIDRLQKGVVVALGDTGKSKRLLGQHLRRSERWMHVKLKAAREGQEDDSTPEGAGNNLPPQAGHELKREILLAFADHHPDPMSVEQVVELLKASGRKVAVRSLSGTLELYVRLGFLRSVGKASNAKQYVAVDPMLVIKVPRGALEKLAERLSNVPMLALSFCLGRGDFGGVAARLHPRAFEKARERLKDAVAGIMAEALKETQLTDEPSSANLEVSAIFAVGTVGGSHDPLDIRGRSDH